MTGQEHAAQQMELVLAFINERPAYIVAMRCCPDVSSDDYRRWEGAAEARRQLATTLGLSVPSEPGDTTAPALATVTLLRPAGGAS